ncbi:MAG: ABC transporter ATP-binding protein [Candidatus Moranbacteria bacterium]|nr:ABC transporter ATP-binding protein [Candidatus Moranbacteria bacterium]
MNDNIAIKAENTRPVDYAIKVNGVSKTFRIPHEKISSLRGAFVSAFKSNGYEEFKALDDISFEVKKGEFFGIIGRNGSGKSTLLKILAGIYQPDKRKFNGVKVNGLISPFLELGIGFNPELSGRDNVYLNAAVLGLTHKQIDEKFDDIVEFSELRRFIDQKVKNYSSGMQVRLAFSVAIHANRDILLMDEVLAVGDSNFQSKCLEEFNRYKGQGKTVVLVTHDIGTVQRYCDRAMLLRNGKIEMIGDPEKVGSKYVYQNMLDEEKRLSNEEGREEKKKDRKTDHERENRMAEITKVEFLGEDGKEKNVFETGEDITARIYFSAKKKIEKPVFGVAIHTQDDIHISGPNTKTSKFAIDFIEGNGFLDFVAPKNQFFTGTYKFTAALYNWECVTPFDFKDKAYDFKVISSDENQNGLMKIETLWKK